MKAGMIQHRPQEWKGTKIRLRYGVMLVPPPPTDASPRQFLDHAAVTGFAAQYGEASAGGRHMGLAKVLERTVMAYMSQYHSEEAEELFEPDFEPLDDDVVEHEHRNIRLVEITPGEEQGVVEG